MKNISTIALLLLLIFPTILLFSSAGGDENSGSRNIPPRLNFSAMFMSPDVKTDPGCSVERVRAWLRTGVDINAKNESGYTRLMNEIYKGNAEIVHLLLEQGADPDVVDYDGWTAITRAVAGGHVEMLKALLKKSKVDVNAQYGNNNTLLSLAVLNGHIDVVKILLEQPGINVDFQNVDGETALQVATFHGYIDIVEALLEKGADPCLADNENETAVEYSAIEGRIEILRIFLEKKDIDVNAQDAQGCTLLMLAVQHEQVDVVEFLLHHGANPNVPDVNGCTAFVYAVLHNHLRIQSALLKKGADIESVKRCLKNIEDGSLDLGIDAHKLRDFLSLFEAITFKSAIPTEQSRLNAIQDVAVPSLVEMPVTENSSLLRAAMDGDYERVKALLNDPEINVNIQDSDGCTALVYAVLQNDVKMQRALLAKKADIEPVKKFLQSLERESVYVEPQRNILREFLHKLEFANKVTKKSLVLESITAEQRAHNQQTRLQETRVDETNRLKHKRIKIGFLIGTAAVAAGVLFNYGESAYNFSTIVMANLVRYLPTFSNNLCAQKITT